MNEQTWESARVLAHNRRFMYLYLCRAFAKEPDAGLLELVGNAAEECSLLDDERGLGAQAHRRVVACLDGLGNDALGTLRRDYTRLFEGPEQPPVPPWESIIDGPVPLLFRESTLEVRRCYHEAGFESAGYPHEADDHLATELHFMAELSQQLEDALAQDEPDIDHARKVLATQRDFAQKRLRNWLPRFAQLFNETAVPSCDFYPAFASLADLHVARDLTAIGELDSLLSPADAPEQP